MTSIYVSYVKMARLIDKQVCVCCISTWTYRMCMCGIGQLVGIRRDRT